MFKKMKKQIEDKEAKSPLRPPDQKKGINQTPNDKTPSGAEARPRTPSSTSTTPGTPNQGPRNKVSSSAPEAEQAIIKQSTPLENAATPPRPKQGAPPSLGESPLFPQYQAPTSVYEAPSDTESEMEESGLTMDSMRKEELFQRYKLMERSSFKYRTRYKEASGAYKDLQKENEKIKNIMSQTQDKALRRISELKEAAELDRGAKMHMEETFRLSLEEKDEMVKVLQTQVKLLKTGKSVDETDSSDKPPASPSTLAASGEGDTATMETVNNLKEKVKRLENLLGKCKETIGKNKERTAQLVSEKEATAKELEQLKEQHSLEQAKFAEKLSKAKDELDQSVEEKALAIAETKQMMHGELEHREQQISELRAKAQAAANEAEMLKAEGEKNKKQIGELKAELEKQLSESEARSDQEKQSLAQELSRGKQAVIGLMQVRGTICPFFLIYPSLNALSFYDTGPVNPCVHASVRPSLRPSNHPSNHPSFHPSNHPSINPSIQPSVCLSVHPSIYILLFKREIRNPLKIQFFPIDRGLGSH
ncbi:golgin subfamily A member 4-like [Lytechinus pictus]|uniref:golgin subfamily A member 4-like n=1 Tax=Lytechinus pictus TaxID=7653 RepID=UPI0030B9E213